MGKRKMDKRKKERNPNGRDRGPQKPENPEPAGSRSSPEPSETTAQIVNEDARNIEKVFTTLHVTPGKAVDEPTTVVVIEQPETTETAPVDGETGEDHVDHAIREVPAPVEAVKPQSVKEESVEDEEEEKEEPTVVTVFDWIKPNHEIDTDRIVFNQLFNEKFAVFLLVIDPEVRNAQEIPQFETFDSESVKKLFARLEKLDYENVWPFGKRNFDVSTEELKKLFSEIHETIKFCLKLACAERGYSTRYKSGNDETMSAAWLEHLDPVIELKTILAIVRELENELRTAEIEFEEFQEFKTISEVILPSLETFNSGILEEYNIHDSLATLYGRKDAGFEISEEEVDEMLEKSLAEEGFGEFTVNVFNCPTIFKTAKHLKLILPHIEKMTTVVDVRVKQSAIQALTQIFTVLETEKTVDLMRELRETPKLTMEKVLGVNPKTFEVKGNEPIRNNYFKIFLTAVGQKDSHKFTLDQVKAALMCFYLVFSAVEVNMCILKILSAKENLVLEEDRQMLTDALLAMPFELRERWEIGEEFSSGETTENEESMYFQFKNLIQTAGSTPSDTLLQFLTANKTHIVSVERVFRMCIKFIDAGKHQKNAVAAIRLLRRPILEGMPLSTRFFEDLLDLALSKYSVPEAKSSESKYEFIDSVLTIVNKFKVVSSLRVDEKAVVERWTNLSHHWFSMLYLSIKYPILNFPSLNITFPWLSEDVWNESMTSEEADPKKYAQLAKVSTAWPNSTDMQLISYLISAHVPLEINRVELYKEMKNYAAEFEISDSWKSSLLEKYEEHIQSLCKPPKIEKEPEDSEENRPQLKNLGDCSGFMRFYADDEWENMPETVREEVFRQRLREGYSNNV